MILWFAIIWGDMVQWMTLQKKKGINILSYWVFSNLFPHSSKVDLKEQINSHFSLNQFSDFFFFFYMASDALDDLEYLTSHPCLMLLCPQLIGFSLMLQSLLFFLLSQLLSLFIYCCHNLKSPSPHHMTGFPLLDYNVNVSF